MICYWSFKVNVYSPKQPAARARTRASRLSARPRMVSWPASADLAPYVSGYSLSAVETIGMEPRCAVFQPGEATLRLVISGGTNWRVRPKRSHWIEPAPASLFGPSSALIWSESHACVVLGASVRPRGWLRLIDRPASKWANRIAGAPQFGRYDWQTLLAEFGALEDDTSVPALFDSFFRAAMQPASRDDAAVGRIEGALLNPSLRTVSDLASAAKLSVRSIERLANRAFGFGPKLLLRRARFLRSFQALAEARASERASTIDSAYTDYSHFVRDSHDFLGLPPQAFLKLNLPLLR